MRQIFDFMEMKRFSDNDLWQYLIQSDSVVLPASFSLFSKMPNDWLKQDCIWDFFFRSIWKITDQNLPLPLQFSQDRVEFCSVLWNCGKTGLFPSPNSSRCAINFSFDSLSPLVMWSETFLMALKTAMNFRLEISK